jgi:hypothetical protein
MPALRGRDIAPFMRVSAYRMLRERASIDSSALPITSTQLQVASSKARSASVEAVSLHQCLGTLFA